MNKLPKPAHKYGYTMNQLSAILTELKISEFKFRKAFGIQTVMYDLNTKGIIYYPQDVERALYKIGNKILGKNWEWD